MAEFADEILLSNLSLLVLRNLWENLVKIQEILAVFRSLISKEI